MAALRPWSRGYRALIFLATAWALASCIFLLDSNLSSEREKFQESDFIMTFYVAGHLAASGHYDQLYPSPNARSFIDSPFDKAAHKLLPHLPRTTTGAYMYTPLVAGFFAPFRWLDPNSAMLVWQIFSIVALAASAFLLAQITRGKGIRYLFSVVLVRAGLFDIVGRSTRFGIRLVAALSRLFFNFAGKTVVCWNGLVVAFAQTSIFFSSSICRYCLCLHAAVSAANRNDSRRRCSAFSYSRSVFMAYDVTVAE